MLQKGQKGDRIIELQQALNLNGAKLAADGDFGAKTEQALKAYQKTQLIKESGVLCLETEAILFPIILKCAKKMFLNRGQYVHRQSIKGGVCLHHTAGGGKAERVVEVWNKDNRKRVSTHFVVGADGTILQTMPLQCWGYHIAMNRVGLNNGDHINGRYIGIEICNYGYASEKNGVFYNYVDGVLRPEEVETLEQPFMGKLHWHKYTDAQVVAVRTLLAELKEVCGFVYEDLPLNADWLEMDKKAQEGKRVLTTHTNFEGNMKADCSPQKAFFEMIKGV